MQAVIGAFRMVCAGGGMWCNSVIPVVGSN